MPVDAGDTGESAVPERARIMAEKSLAVRRDRGDIWGMALSHTVLALLAETVSDWDDAGLHHRHSLLLRRKLGTDMDGVVDCLAGLGRVERHRHRPRAALDYYTEAVDVLDSVNNRGRRAGLEEVANELRLRLETESE